MNRDYLVTGLSGQAGGLKVHRWIVSAPNKTAAKRRISRSTLGTDKWLDERIRNLTADRCDDIPDALLEHVQRV